MATTKKTKKSPGSAPDMPTKRPSKTNPSRNKGKGENDVIVLTKRTCDHCGEQIRINEVVTIQIMAIGPGGKGHSRMAHFAKGHPTVAAVATA